LTDWLPGRTTVFNAQILNSAAYRAVTGDIPPTLPIDATAYTKLGFPFFKNYEELSGIRGNFAAVKSVAEIEKSPDAVVSSTRIVPNILASVGLVNPKGPLQGFRTVKELLKEYGGYHVARF
jgi:hypothetical protein